MQSPSPGPPLGTSRIIWVAILVSVVLLFVALKLSNTPREPADPSLFPILALLALGQAAGSIFLPAYLHRQGVRTRALETREAAGAITPESPSATKRVFVDPDKARTAARQLFQTNLVISLALAESVGLFGFVLGFQGHPDERVAPFFVVAIVLILLRFPRENGAERMLEASAGASFP